MKKELANTTVYGISAGDKIMPPKREVSLWMKRDCQERGLPIDSLLLTVSEVIQNKNVDKRGSWTLIKANYSQEFAEGRPFSFFVLPTTLLQKKN